MIYRVNDPSSLHRSYLRGELSESTIAASWLQQLRIWFDEASASPLIVEPNAVQLATAGTDGRVSVRTVLVKAIDERGIVFYTGYRSAKSRELDSNPYASAVFAWLALERQVRLSGPVEPVGRDETAAYFATRPRGSQLSAWASPQSEVIASRTELQQLVTEAEARFAGQDVPPPPNWGGYLLRPESVEFWQGRADRLHDRLRYRREGDGWVLERLAP
jgi:pyridoxamine 5'-phosphate oxidase